MDEARFEAALSRALLRGGGGIGMLGEKTLHSALKYYYEPDETKHEREFCGFHADILNENGVIEVQTRNLFALKRKLAEYLKLVPVTLVHPVIRRRGIIYLDPETGELSKPRLSPKRGRPEDAFLEFAHIRDELKLPGLRIVIPLIDADEYRVKDGLKTRYGKKALKFELVPKRIEGETELARPEDWAELLPEGLKNARFSVKELAKEAALSERTAQAMCCVLASLGVLARERDGRRYIYRVEYENIADTDENEPR